MTNPTKVLTRKNHRSWYSCPRTEDMWICGTGLMRMFYGVGVTTPRIELEAMKRPTKDNYEIVPGRMYSWQARLAEHPDTYLMSELSQWLKKCYDGGYKYVGVNILETK